MSPFIKVLLPSLQDFFEGVERVLKNTAPAEVAKTSTYNRAALKRVVKDYDAKDVRKHVDALFKRVEKHFTDAAEGTVAGTTNNGMPGTVMTGVWKACEDEVLRITEQFSKRINQCYSDSGVSLEYTAADVESAFKRHRSPA